MRKISNALSKNRLESIRGEVKETLVMTISAQPQRPMRRRDRELPREEALRAARAAGHAVLSFIHPDTGAPQGRLKALSTGIQPMKRASRARG